MLQTSFIDVVLLGDSQEPPKGSVFGGAPLVESLRFLLLPQHHIVEVSSIVL